MKHLASRIFDIVVIIAAFTPLFLIVGLSNPVVW